MRSNLTECALIALKTKIDREDQGEVGPLVATNSKDLKRVPLVTLGSAILQSATAISKLSGLDEPDVDSGYILARALVERLKWPFYRDLVSTWGHPGAVCPFDGPVTSLHHTRI